MQFTYIIYIWATILLICCPYQTNAQTVTARSESKKPDWLANGLPTPGNATYSYKIAQAEDQNLTKARYDCIKDLAEKVKQDKKITGTIQTGGSLEQAAGKETAFIEFKYTAEGEPQQIVYQKTDEYWELISYPNGSNQYRFYTLYAVANTENQTVAFDKVSFTYKYGARGLVRSVIPGWGQLYKGSKTKGLCIMGGEVALIGGVVAFESMRSNYNRKINQTQNVNHIRDYASKADNCATFRNICIGGAAALYIYNLIDALVANGTKRTVVKKNKLSLHPVASPEYNGIGLAYQF